jgi:hypothetical protein
VSVIDERKDVYQEPDLLQVALVVRILIGTIAVGLGICLAAYLILRGREQTLRPSGRFPEASLPAPHEVANVRQALFQRPFREPGPLEAQRAELERAGWIDRAQGLVHIPIEAAMELVARRAEARRPAP